MKNCIGRNRSNGVDKMKCKFNINVVNAKIDIKSFLYIFIPALLLACLAYCFKPFGDNVCDLTAYYGWMDKMLIFEGLDLFLYLMRAGEIIIMIYFYIIARIGNYQLLQFFPTLIFYYSMFYMIYNYAKKNKISKKYIFIVIILFLSLFKYIFIVSSFRYSLAYCLFALGIYFDLIEHKTEKKYKLFYILPIFIHISTIMLLFFRILFYFKEKKIFWFILGLVLLICIFPLPFIKFLALFNSLPLVSYLVNKINYYLLSEIVPIFLQYIFRIFQAIVFLIFGLIAYKINNNSKEKDYILFYIMICIFMITTVSYYSVFMRLIDFVLFISPVVLYKLLTHSINMKKIYKICLYAMIFALIVAGIRIQVPIFINMYF